MRRSILINENWLFTDMTDQTIEVDIPHTWNALDGQDGGNDYKRGSCIYTKEFKKPEYDPLEECVYLEFKGVNASAEVAVNGVTVCSHHGGYSTFRVEITSVLKAENRLEVRVDNSVNDSVYPQKADFTFYGGIYRDVSLVVVNKTHFGMDNLGESGLLVTPVADGSEGKIEIKVSANAEDEKVEVLILDREGLVAAQGTGKHQKMVIQQAHRWNGVKDPYLYTAKAQIRIDGEIVDEVTCRFGIREYYLHPDQGFYLNGRSYPLHGVSRHQDRKGAGNAITKKEHDEDMALISEVGANTIRLAHYQHDQYFYDLCDEYGMIVWAEIPYISEHMPEGRENTVSQMKELIIQNYNHPSIVCWGISNEITISTKDHGDMMENHRILNELCHNMDPTRFTTLACYAMCLPWDPVVHKVSDVVSYNLYLGWYVPGLWLNDLFMKLFHMIWPKRCLGYSEYGAEGMPNLHSSKPRRGDHTEEYQSVYHEYMLNCFERHPFLWSTHVWNMFDFAADARDQGGEAGMNHKGLVTFDRKVKKDSFYLYKAWWSGEPFVHLCGSRYVNRAESVTTIKVYSNQTRIELYCDGKKVAEQDGEHVFTFRLPITGRHVVEAVSGALREQIEIRKVEESDASYKLTKSKKKSSNWV